MRQRHHSPKTKDPTHQQVSGVELFVIIGVVSSLLYMLRLLRLFEYLNNTPNNKNNGRVLYYLIQQTHQQKQVCAPRTPRRHFYYGLRAELYNVLQLLHVPAWSNNSG